MSHSIHNADRATHRRIVLVALTAAIAIVGSATALRISSSPSSLEATKVIKAGKPVILTSATAPIMR